MDYLSIFVRAFAVTWLVACLAEIGIRLVTSCQPVRFGAFCVACGFAIAAFSGRAAIGPEAARLLCQAAGAILALALLWYHWLKRPERMSKASTKN